MKILLPFLMFLIFLNISVYAQNEVRLVTELGPGATNGFGEEAEIIGTIGKSILINNNGEIHISNGFAWGTKIIGDIGVDNRVSHTRVEVGGKFYFVAKSELLEVDPSIPSMRTLLNDYDGLGNLVAFNGELYMEVEDSNSEEYFAKVNPETEEVTKIFDVNSFGGIRDLVVHNNLIYTIHWPTDKDGAYLSSSDGTPGNVDEFYFFHDGSELSSIRTSNMTSAGDNLYFWYNNGQDDYVLYVSDGTAAGTIELEESFEPANFYDYNANRAIGTIGNNIFFNSEGDSGQHLWMSDGTEAGTQKVPLIDGATFPRFFTNYNDKLYFRAAHTSGGFSNLSGMIVTDGTFAGTEKAWDITTHPELNHSEAWHLIEHNGKMYFDGNSTNYGNELFETDGTIDNTIRLSDISPGDGSEFTYNYASAEENLFFFGQTDASGLELYVYGPTTSSTLDQYISISVSPNPAKDFLEFTGLDLNGQTARVFNMEGRVIHKEIVASNKINIIDLIPGYYQLIISTGLKKHSAKFIKQ